MATKDVFSNRAPMFRTVIAAAVCAASAFSPTLADVNVTEDVVLDADADWRDRALSTSPKARRSTCAGTASGFQVSRAS